MVPRGRRCAYRRRWVGRNPNYEKLRRQHWAWQPLTKPQVPTVKDTAWPRDDIDRFLLARLEAKELAPGRRRRPA